MFKIISQTTALSSSMAAYSKSPQNLLANNYCDLEDRPRLSRQLQLHLSCLSRTTFTWAASTQITKYVPLHANPWMYFTSQASSDYT